MQLLRMLIRKWFIIAVAGIVAALIGYSYASFCITPLYSAKSTMLVDLRNSVHEDFSSEQINIAQKYVDTFVYIMKSNIVLEPVIEELGLNESVSSLASKLTVSNIEDTLLIKVSVEYPSKTEALAIIKTLDKLAPEIINQRITSGYIIEIEYPTVSSGPVSPNVTRHTFFGGVIGILIAVAILLVIFLFNNKVRSVAELQRTIDLPLLGVIPTLQNNESNGKGV
jgi:capsular polysaccharide biosynthesis protein